MVATELDLCAPCVFVKDGGPRLGPIFLDRTKALANAIYVGNPWDSKCTKNTIKSTCPSQT